MKQLGSYQLRKHPIRSHQYLILFGVNASMKCENGISISELPVSIESNKRSSLLKEIADILSYPHFHLQMFPYPNKSD